MDLLGWIIIGFLGGALSGAVVGGRTARGCLPNIVVGVLGAVVGGWLAGQMGFSQVRGLPGRGRRRRLRLDRRPASILEAVSSKN